MKIIRWSVHHPAAVLAFYAAILVLAALALAWAIPTRMMPYVESPMLAVVTESMGWPPEEVERRVSSPIEQHLSQVQGLRFIRSTSMPGMSVVSIEFPYHYDMRKAMQDVQARLVDANSWLQLDARNSVGPRLLPIDPLNIPVLRVAVHAPRWDAAKLREFIDTFVVGRLQGLPGVESVYAVGGTTTQVEVDVDRDRLAAFGWSLLDVRDAIERSTPPLAAGNVLTPGSVSQAMVAPKDSLDELAATVIGTRGGRPVELREVATVAMTATSASHHHHHHGQQHLGAGTMPPMEPSGSLYYLNGRPAVEINVIQQPDGSSPRTIAAVRDELGRIQAECPGLTFEEAYDNAHFVGIMIRNLVEDLAVGVLLTAGVLFLFLRDLRGTLIALVTIPTSLAVAVVGFVPLGLSLNSSSLVGLLLAIGRLVDDAIIDLHSVHRHLALGKSAEAAAVEGCSEVRRAVVGATAVICLAMLPLTFCGGVTQDMFTAIAWPFILSLAASLMVAFTLTPVLASQVYRGVGILPRPMSPLLTRYGQCLAWALRHRGMVLASLAAVCYLAAMMYPLIGSEMMPLSDVGQAYAVLEAPPGTSLAETARMAGVLDAILRRRPEVLKVSTEVGWEPAGTYFTGYGVGGDTTATMMITLADKDARRASIWDVLDGVWKEARQALPSVRSLTLKEMGCDVMASSMAPVEVLIYGPDLERLDWLASQTARMARANPGLAQVTTAWSLGAPVWRVQVDERRAAQVGLTPDAIADQAYNALYGGLAATSLAQDDGRSVPIMIGYQEGQREGLTDLGNTLLVGAGRQVPLRAVATLRRTSGPTMIMHDNLRRTNSVMGFYRRGGPGSMKLTMDVLMDCVMNLPLPPHYGVEQRGDMTQMMDSFTRLGKGFALALLCIYLALVVQMQSARLPLAILVAIPLELTGVFGALLLSHQTFSTVSLLGIVMLNGMDVTASILLVDRIQQLRAAGQDYQEAILEAGRTRLFPILMTVFVTLVVMAPVAFAPGTGLDAWAPLATVVVGGLLVSSLLTLVTVPVLYSFLANQTGQV